MTADARPHRKDLSPAPVRHRARPGLCIREKPHRSRGRGRALGADSLIEALAGLVVVWLFTCDRRGSHTAERRAQI
jgi:hypothetical protein